MATYDAPSNEVYSVFYMSAPENISIMLAIISAYSK